MSTNRRQVQTVLGIVSNSCMTEVSQAWFQSEPFGSALASRRADLGVVIEAELTALSRGEKRPRPIFVNGRHKYLDHS